jgi:tol-pal system protein YbgF
MLRFTKTAIITAVLTTPFSLSSAFADEAALTQRIDRLERIIQGQGLVSLLSRVDQLQNEVQRLNGDNEALQHKLEQMQRRQRELYIDLDERIQAQAQTNTPSTAVIPSTSSQTEANDTSINPDSQSDTTNETSQTTAEPTPVAVENGEAAYQAALQTLRSGQYEQAVTAFTEFPKTYPQSSYLPNAYYWKGEAHLVLADFDNAVNSFQTVLDAYPDSRKVPDAMLKKGFAQFSLGKVDESKATLTTVIQQYPTTSAARLAKVKLERIKQSSN